MQKNKGPEFQRPSKLNKTTKILASVKFNHRLYTKMP